MNQTGRFFIVLVAIACSSLSVWCASDSGQLLEKGVFQLDILQEPEMALQTFDAAVEVGSLSQDEYAEALYGRIRCLLKLENYDEARLVFGELMALDVSGEWIRKALEIVPANFVVRHVPWKPGSLVDYNWKDVGKGKGGAVRLFVDAREGDGEHHLHLNAFVADAGFHYGHVEFESTSLEMLASSYRARNWGPIEVQYLIDLPAGRRDVSDLMDRLLLGQLLRQYKLSLGFTKRDQIYSWKNGGLIDVEFHVNALERIASLPSGFVDCWVVSMTLGGESLRFWISRSGGSELVKMASDSIDLEQALPMGNLQSDEIDRWVGNHLSPFGWHRVITDAAFLRVEGTRVFVKNRNLEQTLWMVPGRHVFEDLSRQPADNEGHRDIWVSHDLNRSGETAVIRGILDIGGEEWTLIAHLSGAANEEENTFRSWMVNLQKTQPKP
jgi:hypothetical protein